uniref:Uncharacterized protein n=1 Tax=Helianthus annuus TaxID=4232 RepID=A0A251SVK0_HELAN
MKLSYLRNLITNFVGHARKWTRDSCKKNIYLRQKLIFSLLKLSKQVFLTNLCY